MKLGLLSDIHADLPGLHRALALLQAHAVDKLVCAGDLIDGRTAGAGVVRYFSECSIPCVQGNHDEWAVEPGSEHYRRLYAPDRRRDDLTEESFEYLERLPQSLAFEVEDQRVLIAHGAPWGNMNYVYPDGPRHIFQRVAHEAEADVVVLGHTHEPMFAQGAGVTIVNPGSVNPSRGSGTCAVLTLPTLEFTVYHLLTAEVYPCARIQF
jgi:putative phosphoesterase